jgi:HSF-type DNA-binding
LAVFGEVAASTFLSSYTNTPPYFFISFFSVTTVLECATRRLRRHCSFFIAASFQRQLNIYQFYRLTKTGPDQNSYYNELFLRGREDLCSFLVRRLTKNQKNSAGWNVRKAIDPDTEPDFYQLPFLPPVVPAGNAAGDCNTSPQPELTSRQTTTQSHTAAHQERNKQGHQLDRSYVMRRTPLRRWTMLIFRMPKWPCYGPLRLVLCRWQVRRSTNPPTW